MEHAAVRITNLIPAVELTAAREARLIDGLVTALPSLKMRELFAVRRDMFREADLITIAVDHATGSAVGALSSRWAELDSGARFLHVTTQFVGDNHRNGAVFRRSWATHLHAVRAGPNGFPRVIALKTYNPLVFCAMRTISRIAGVIFYPSLDGKPANSGAARLANRVAQAIAAGHPFDPATGIIGGAGVPKDLYSGLPRSADDAVNAHFADKTTPGDRVLCILLFPTQQSANKVMRFFGPIPVPS
jgi:hypothetical protein